MSISYETFKPAAELSKYIAYYWILKSDRLLCGDNKQRIVPNGMIEILINFGDDISCAERDDNYSIQPKIVLCGQKNRFFDVRQSGNIRLLSIVLTPIGANAFFPFSFSEITNKSLNFEDLFPNSTEIILNMVHDAKSDREKVEIVETFLLNKLLKHSKSYTTLMSSILHRIRDLRGNITINSLCSDYELNAKFIERRFAEFIGITPKTFLRIVRFQNVLSRYNTFAGNLTSLAYATGFYDQAHFTKEIKKFTGESPKEFFSNKPIYSDFFEN